MTVDEELRYDLEWWGTCVEYTDDNGERKRLDPRKVKIGKKEPAGIFKADMNVDKNTVEAPREQKLNRQQLRAKERLETEARQAHQKLAERFLAFMIDCENPDGPEVAEKQNQLSAQWILYCKAKNLVPETHQYIKQYCEGVIKEYKIIKNPSEPQPVSE